MAKFKSTTVTKGKFMAILVILIVLNKKYNCRSQQVLLKSSNTINFQSVRCIVFDKTYGKFDYCGIKPVNRSLKYLNIRMVPFKTITNFIVHLRVLKRATGGFKPFGIEVSLDMCKYLAGKRNIVFDWFYYAGQPYFNRNVTCPIKTDVILKDLPSNLISLPSVFPDGIYLADATGSTLTGPVGALKVVFEIKEKEYWDKRS